MDDTLLVEFAGLGEPLELTEEVLKKGFVEYREVRSERGLTSEFSSFEDRAMSAQHGVNPFSGRFEQARYFYEIHLPRLEDKPTKKGFTILLRVVNTAGDAVTEEQEILLQPPGEAWDRIPVACWDDDAIELAEG